MKQITMIGVDLAKNVFQSHGVDASQDHQRPDLATQSTQLQPRPTCETAVSGGSERGPTACDDLNRG